MRVVGPGEGDEGTTIVEEWVTDVLGRVKAKRGTKRSPARAVAIIRAIRKGSSREAAAMFAGIEYTTLWRWEKDDPVFAEVLAMGEGAAEAALSERVYDAAIVQWQAAAWMLERKYPKRWGRRDRTDITIETRRLAETIAERNGLDPAELLARAEAIVSEAQETNRRASDV